MRAVVGRLVGGAFGLIVLVLGQAANAGVFTQSLDFFTNESLWGPGGSSLDFGASGSTSVGVVDLFAYELGASSGSVNANHEGELRIGYVDTLTSPGVATLNLGFFGDTSGGRLKTDLGAFINVTTVGGLTVIDRDYGLNIDTTYNPTVPDNVSGSDSVTGITASVGIPLIAEAGVDFDIEQTSELDITGLTGTLEYTLRGSGLTQTELFALSSGNIEINIDLLQPGIWDFGLVGVDLENLFTTTYDLELVLFEEHTGRIGCLVDSPLGCVIPELGTIRNDTTLADIGIWDREPFALSFINAMSLGGFSIDVREGVPIADVPEPGIFYLFGAGLVGFGLRRKPIKAA